MPKIKTKRATAKRFRVTANGKVVRQHAYKSHILTKKSRTRKRKLRQLALVSAGESRTIKRMLGIG